MRHCILIYGDEPALLQTRGLLLRHAGFFVVSCAKDQIDTIGSGFSVHLVIVGDSLTAEEQRRLAKTIRGRWNNAKIVFLDDSADSSEKLSEYEYRSQSGNPSQLIEMCHEILQTPG
jgi:DNA-binding response OmpR family regulator